MANEQIDRAALPREGHAHIHEKVCALFQSAVDEGGADGKARAAARERAMAEGLGIVAQAHDRAVEALRAERKHSDTLEARITDLENRLQAKGAKPHIRLHATGGTRNDA